MRSVTTAKDGVMPVSLDDAKIALDMLDSDFDLDITRTLEAAVEYCETVVDRSLRVSHTVRQDYAGWPVGEVRLIRQPVIAISSVTYFDGDGAEQTVAANNFRLLESDAAKALEWDDDFTCPTLDNRSDAVRITYTAGYSTIANVPDQAKQAIILTLRLLWGRLEERDAKATKMARDSILGSLSWGAFL